MDQTPSPSVDGAKANSRNEICRRPSLDLVAVVDHNEGDSRSRGVGLDHFNKIERER